MKRYLMIAAALLPMPAFALELLCFTVSSLTYSNMGQNIEHENSDAEALRDPEYYMFFDLKAAKTVWFWSDTDGTRHRETSELQSVGNQLFVAEYDSGAEKSLTTYRFDNGFSDGLLTEGDYIAFFRCERIALDAAEAKYSIAFSDYE